MVVSYFISACLCASAVICFRGSLPQRTAEVRRVYRQIKTLIETADCDSRRSRVVVQLSPAGATLTGTPWANVTPDAAVNVTLIEVISRGDDLARSGIVIESFPAGTIRATTWGARVAPDLSVVVQLIKLSVSSRDRCSSRIVV